MLSYAWISFKWLNFLRWYYYYYHHIYDSPYYSKLFKDKLEQLGILGIKIGQYLCNRPDISSDIMKKELSVFLSQNKVHGIRHTESLLKKANINVQLGEVIGSGSLTQVYTCTLEGDDRPLVVKVKHPEVEQLKIEIQVIKTILYFTSCFSSCRVVQYMDWNDFFGLIEEQMDMRNEISHMKKFAEIYRDMDEICVPEFVVGNEDCIVMTFCQGKTLNLIPREEPIYHKAHMLFVCSVIYSGLAHRILHGDVHEGNILVKENGDISIIDFGVCTRLTIEQLIGIFAVSKFECTPNYDNCHELVIALTHDAIIEKDPVKLNLLTNEILDRYTEEIQIPANYMSFFNLIVSLSHKYKILIRGNIISYFMNVILLEGLSPFHGEHELSALISINYMNSHPFFKKNHNKDIEKYFKSLVLRTKPELLKKYNIKI